MLTDEALAASSDGNTGELPFREEPTKRALPRPNSKEYWCRKHMGKPRRTTTASHVFHSLMPAETNRSELDIHIVHINFFSADFQTFALHLAV
jgi:hypothetical protein